MLTEASRVDFLMQAMETWLTTTPDLIFIKDMQLNYVACSPSFLKMAGASNLSDIVGKTDYEIFSHELANRYTRDDHKLLDSGIPIIDNVEPIPDSNGKKSYSSTCKHIITDNDGNRVGLLGIGRDVTAHIELLEERRSSEKLRVLAETDALTGLCNRDCTLSQIRECICGYGMSGQHALLFIDLDCFKNVNDSLGHAYGDKVLRSVAQKLQSLVRSHDVVGRVGGDEFMVFFKDIATVDSVRVKAEEICRALPISVKRGKQTFEVTCSIGVALYCGDGKPLETLCDEADQAMYAAKEHGRNSVSFGE